MNQILQRYKPQIDQRITALCNSTSGSDVPWAEDVGKRLADFSVRGKSVRGSIFLYTCELFGQTIDDVGINIAASLELLHAALLIHDDIIDHDQIRRGKPSMHAQYELWGKEHEVTDAKKFGEGMALCVGDIAIFGAFSHLAGLALPPTVHKRILTLMLKEFLTVGFGELHDTALGYLPTMPSPAEVLSMYQKKTARYTFSLPFVTACILTEQDETTQLAMSELGEALGCIFQLRDDELTLVGKEEVVGKTIGNDIIENKKTYATTLLWELVTPEEKKQLEHIFGNSSIETKDIIYVQSLFSKYDIHTLILTRMMNYEKIADTTITTLNLPDIKKDELRGITHYLATREK